MSTTLVSPRGVWGTARCAIISWVSGPRKPRVLKKATGTRRARADTRTGRGDTYTLGKSRGYRSVSVFANRPYKSITERNALHVRGTRPQGRGSLIILFGTLSYPRWPSPPPVPPLSPSEERRGKLRWGKLLSPKVRLLQNSDNGSFPRQPTCCYTGPIAVVCVL